MLISVDSQALTIRACADCLVKRSGYLMLTPLPYLLVPLQIVAIQKLRLQSRRLSEVVEIGRAIRLDSWRGDLEPLCLYAT
jgi:hypothetical protein